MAVVRRGSRVLGRTYSQVKLEIGHESAPGAFFSEAASLSQVGASTATQAALMLLRSLTRYAAKRSWHSTPPLLLLQVPLPAWARHSSAEDKFHGFVFPGFV